MNYPGLNIRDYAQAYYDASYKRLQKLKLRLDPKNRFGYQQGVSPWRACLFYHLGGE